jgi:hypothetical protein
MYPNTHTMVVDPRRMVVSCLSPDGTPIGDLYVRGMCEELGLSPTLLSHRGGLLERVPVWDASPQDSALLAEVLPAIAERYALETTGASIHIRIHST